MRDVPQAADLRGSLLANGAACTAPDWDVTGWCGLFNGEDLGRDRRDQQAGCQADGQHVASAGAQAAGQLAAADQEQLPLAGAAATATTNAAAWTGVKAAAETWWPSTKTAQ